MVGEDLVKKIKMSKEELKKPKYACIELSTRQKGRKALRLAKLFDKTRDNLSQMKKNVHDSHDESIAREAKLFVEMFGERLVKETRMTKAMAMLCCDPTSPFDE